MRSLKKDKKKIYIAKRLPSVPILDDNGLETGEFDKVYDEPVLLDLNVKPVTDKIECQMFGENIDKMHKILYTLYDSKCFEINDFSSVWLGIKPNGILTDKDPNNPMNNNYIVDKVINLGGQNVAFIKKISGEVK